MFIHVSQFLLPNIMFTRKYCDNASPQLDIVDLHKDTVFCVKVIFETCEIILHDVTVHRRIISLSRFINFAFWRLSSFTMKVELVYVHYLNEKYGTSQPTEVDLASLRATVDLCWIHFYALQGRGGPGMASGAGWSHFSIHHSVHIYTLLKFLMCSWMLLDVMAQIVKNS